MAGKMRILWDRIRGYAEHLVHHAARGLSAKKEDMENRQSLIIAPTPGTHFKDGGVDVSEDVKFSPIGLAKIVPRILPAEGEEPPAKVIKVGPTLVADENGRPVIDPNMNVIKMVPRDAPANSENKQSGEQVTRSLHDMGWPLRLRYEAWCWHKFAKEEGISAAPWRLKEVFERDPVNLETFHRQLEMYFSDSRQGVVLGQKFNAFMEKMDEKFESACKYSMKIMWQNEDVNIAMYRQFKTPFLDREEVKMVMAESRRDMEAAKRGETPTGLSPETRAKLVHWPRLAMLDPHLEEKSCLLMDAAETVKLEPGMDEMAATNAINGRLTEIMRREKISTKALSESDEVYFERKIAAFKNEGESENPVWPPFEWRNKAEEFMSRAQGLVNDAILKARETIIEGSELTDKNKEYDREFMREESMLGDIEPNVSSPRRVSKVSREAHTVTHFRMDAGTRAGFGHDRQAEAVLDACLKISFANLAKAVNFPLDQNGRLDFAAKEPEYLKAKARAAEISKTYFSLLTDEQRDELFAMQEVVDHFDEAKRLATTVEFAPTLLVTERGYPVTDDGKYFKVAMPSMRVQTGFCVSQGEIPEFCFYTTSRMSAPEAVCENFDPALFDRDQPRVMNSAVGAKPENIEEFQKLLVQHMEKAWPELNVREILKPLLAETARVREQEREEQRWQKASQGLRM